jgi:Tol biopolymer transport system component
MQKRKSSLPIILGVLAALVLLTACCAIILTTGVLAFLVPARADVTPMIDLDFEPSLPTEPEIFPFSDLPGMPIQDVQVEFVVGSPAAAFVIASGEWGGLCSQLAETQVRYVEGNQIHIQLLSDLGREDCPADQLGLPFSFRIPLNMVEMPTDKYSVIVNGVQADFDWTGSTFSAEGHFPDFSQPSPGGLPPIKVGDVRVEIGVGSPIPVEVAVAGQWPNLCAQLGRTTTHIFGQQIDIFLEATPEAETCPPDYLGLSFALRLPLNMVEMPEGEYTVTVNGWQTTFAWPPTGEPQPTAVDLNAAEPVRMVYVGPDGNLLLNDLPDLKPRQLTTDAALPQDAEATYMMEYTEPRLSSDGRFLAYRRAFGTKQGDGMALDLGLWVMDLETMDPHAIYSMSPGGYSWKPGTHLLAYVPELNSGYFASRPGAINPDFAESIRYYDADTGEIGELVAPYGGYAMYNPIWSPDGRFLAFDEVLYIEGRGPLAYYDFAAGEYITLEQPLGNYSWSPDGETLVFDNMVYIATGTERIQFRSRQDGAVSDFSPDFAPGYASQPVFSPLGDQIAYLVAGSPESQLFTLYVQGFSLGAAGDPAEAVSFGEYEGVYRLNWSPDGRRVIFSAGPYGEHFIVEADLLTGETHQLAGGMQPTLSVIP